MTTAPRAPILPRSVKKLVATAIASGLVLGFLLGLADAFIVIYANRYVDLGMYNIALVHLTKSVDYFSLTVPVAVVAIFLICRALSALLPMTRLLHTFTFYAGSTVLLLSAWLTVGYRLNSAPWYPDFFSLLGFSSNLTITLVFILLAFVLFRYSAAVTRSLSITLRKLSNPHLALLVILILIVLNGVFWYRQQLTPSGGLNVLLITVDTLRADHLHAYGYRRATSPSIDTLARDGILFSQAVAQWPKTTPSLASMMTSTYPHRNGVIRTARQPLPQRHLTLAEILKDAGYSTVGIVTNGNLSKAYGFNQGFDQYIQAWQESASVDAEDAERVTEYAISWLRRHSHAKPFFMWLHYSDPHARYEPPPAYDGLYVGDIYHDGSRRAPLNPGFNDDIGGIPRRSRLADRDDINYYIAQYDAEIRYTDEHIGKVLRTLETMRLSENTMIIFTADHGESLGEHNYYFEHGRLPYDHCVRVPLIIKTPTVDSKNRIIRQPVELINVLPTVLDNLNISVPREAQGKSLVPLMLGDTRSVPEYAFTEAGYARNYQRVIRTQKWKLIYAPDEKDQRIMQGMPFELYDIENDPNELNNLVHVEAELAEKLKSELFKWIKSSAGTDNPATSPRRVTVDRATERVLRSLGYTR
jgi:arylsulfatase A-like enzyme